MSTNKFCLDVVDWSRKRVENESQLRALHAREISQASDSLLDEGFVQGIQVHLQSRDLALTRLAQLGKKPEDATAGPMMADDLTSLLQRSAALYHSAFSAGNKTFPFIRELG